MKFFGHRLCLNDARIVNPCSARYLRPPESDPGTRHVRRLNGYCIGESSVMVSKAFGCGCGILHILELDTDRRFLESILLVLLFTVFAAFDCHRHIRSDDDVLDWAIRVGIVVHTSF